MKSKSIRLTGNSYALLALLEYCGEATSYEIKQAMEGSIENFWPVPHTTAYEEPARLAAAGYLVARQEEGGRRRRVYALTDAGKEALREWAAEPTAALPQLRDELVLKIFAGADPGPLCAPRVAWHRAKADELQGYLDEVRGVEGLAGSERTLLIGIAYHEKMLEVLELMGASARNSR
ncbi:MAG: PadR family transcriptional regulator [Solirubrobacterales bacterium]